MMQQLPPNPTIAPSQSVLASSDTQPVPQPQLGNQFATIDNCALVSPPSTYTAVADCGCGTTVMPQSYVAPAAATAAVVPAPVAVPAAVPTATAAVPLATTTVPTNARQGMPMRSLITFGQERNVVQVGQGLVGQPVAYVPGQPIRNWLRYFMP
jgi:hypothetical protein